MDDEDDQKICDELSAMTIRLWDAIQALRTDSSEKATRDLIHQCTLVHSAVEQYFTTSVHIISPTASFTGHNIDLTRLKKARARVDDSANFAPLGARIPVFLHDYLNAFVMRTNHLKPAGAKEITKQQAVAEALCLFVAIYQVPPEREW